MPLEKPTKPDAITAVPTPVPLRTDRANFAARGDAMMTWFPDGVDEINTTSDYMDDAANFAEQEANEAEASATAAEASNTAAAVNAAAAAASAGAILWVTGSTYTAGVVRYSPTNFSTYRDTVGGLSSTDPASDTTGRWQSAMLPSAEAIALPALLPTIAINALSGASNVSVQVTRAMEKYRYNRLGYLVADAAGVLGVDHDPATKAPRGWKIDPQTVYLSMRSTEMDNGAYWLATNVIVTPAARMGIDGVMSMFKVEVTATAATNFNRQTTVTATTQYVSFRVAKGNAATGVNTFGAYNLSTGSAMVIFTLNYDTGAIGHSTGSGATAVPVGGGIWEVRFAISGLTIGNNVAFYCGASGPAQTSGNYFYASHIDVADKPNASPHPTAGSNITRPADIPTISGPDFTDNYNQVEGTFFVAVEMPVPVTPTRTLFQADDGTLLNRVVGGRDTNGAVTAVAVAAGLITGTTLTVPTSGKLLFVATSYKNNDWRLTLRGLTATASALPTLPTVALTRLIIGGAGVSGTEMGGWLKALYYYPKAFSAGESRALVTHA